MERSTIFHGKIHELPMAIFNSYLCMFTRPGNRKNLFRTITFWQHQRVALFVLNQKETLLARQKFTSHMLHAIFPNFYLHPVILGGKCNVNVGKYAIHLGKLIHISLT